MLRSSHTTPSLQVFLTLTETARSVQARPDKIRRCRTCGLQGAPASTGKDAR